MKNDTKVEGKISQQYPTEDALLPNKSAWTVDLENPRRESYSVTRDPKNEEILQRN
jgi:hypothetical protein